MADELSVRVGEGFDQKPSPWIRNDQTFKKVYLDRSALAAVDDAIRLSLGVLI